MEKVNIDRRFNIRARTVFDVSETIIEIEAADGAENALCSQEIGRSASFRSMDEAEEYVRLLEVGC